MSASIAAASPRPAAVRRVSVYDLLLLLPAAILVGYVLSPYVAVARLALAMERHDVRTMTDAVDWNSVRTELGTEFGAALPVRTVSTSDDLPDFGSSFASTATENALQDDVTPARVADMLSSSSVTVRPGLLAALHTLVADGRFVGMRRFDLALGAGSGVVVGGAAVHVRFEFDTRHGWRVGGVMLPRELMAANNSRT